MFLEMLDNRANILGNLSQSIIDMLVEPPIKCNLQRDLHKHQNEHD